jgi:hypothetical protein
MMALAAMVTAIGAMETMTAAVAAMASAMAGMKKIRQKIITQHRRHPTK